MPKVPNISSIASKGEKKISGGQLRPAVTVPSHATSTKGAHKCLVIDPRLVCEGSSKSYSFLHEFNLYGPINVSFQFGSLHVHCDKVKIGSFPELGLSISQILASCPCQKSSLYLFAITNSCLVGTRILAL